MKIVQPKLNVVELAMWGALLVSVAYAAGVSRTQARLDRPLSRDSMEMKALADMYGPSRDSEHLEEWILEGFLPGQTKRCVRRSRREPSPARQQYVLPRNGLGMVRRRCRTTGQICRRVQQNRPGTTFVPLFISDVSNQQATLYVTKNDLVASGVREFTGIVRGSNPDGGNNVDTGRRAGSPQDRPDRLLVD